MCDRATVADVASRNVETRKEEKVGESVCSSTSNLSRARPLRNDLETRSSQSNLRERNMKILITIRFDELRFRPL